MVHVIPAKPPRRVMNGALSKIPESWKRPERKGRSEGTVVDDIAELT